MSPRTGAYARRGDAQALEELPLPAHVDHGPGWMAYLETTSGLMVTPCGHNATHAQRVNDGRRALAERNMPYSVDGALALGGVLVDPAGEHHGAWGDPIDTTRPRWRSIHRVTRWTSCQGCGLPLWPGRVVTVRLAPHLVAEGAANDEVCATCQAGREESDPRPAWPIEAPQPPLATWPDWMRPDKRRRVPLPRGYRFMGQPRGRT